MLFCHITSKVDGDAYQELKKQRDTGGYPGLVFLDPEGELMTEHNDNRTPSSFLAYAELLQEVQGERADVADGKEAARARLLALEMQTAMLSVEVAEKRRKELPKESAAERRLLDAALRDLKVIEVARLVARPTNLPRSKAGERLKAITDALGRPRSIIAQREYWPLIVDYAESMKDKRLMRDGLKMVRKVFGKDLNQRWFDQRMERLKLL